MKTHSLLGSPTRIMGFGWLASALLFVACGDGRDSPFDASSSGSSVDVGTSSSGGLDAGREDAGLSGSSSSGGPAGDGGLLPPADFHYGVAMASLESAPSVLPGHLGGEVFLTPDAHYTYYVGKGLDHVRMEAAWERLQPNPYGPLGEGLLDVYGDPDDPLRDPIAIVRHDLDLAASRGLSVILDLNHNYGRRYVGYDGTWNGKRLVELGSSELPIAAFVDYSVKIVEAFASHPAVVAIELMNEPHDLTIGSAGWQDACQQAIVAIRQTNTTVPIMIDGYSWSSATQWPDVNPTLHQLSDPSDRLVFSAHLYFDADSSGTYQGGDEVAPSNFDLGVQRLEPFVSWLAAHGLAGRGHVGEYGAPDHADWREIIQRFTAYAKSSGVRLTAHQDISYENDPYQMNLFPATGANHEIIGGDRWVVSTLHDAATSVP